MAANQQKRPAVRKRKTLKIGRFHIEPWHVIAVALIVYDFAAVCVSYRLALLFRWDFVISDIPRRYLNPFRQ